MVKKRKKYLVTVDSEAFACSLVTNPAVEELFVTFSEDKPLIEKFADESKHMLTGVVAIPNKPIFRRGKNGEEYDIVFSEEAIEKMAMNYMRNYRQNEVTLQHQEETDGVYLVEQWIKQDAYRDKSAVIGLSEELPVGSWIQTYYVDSNDVWERIQSGELRGLSLECALGLEEFESHITNEENNDSAMTNEEMFKKIKQIFKEVFSPIEEKVETPSVEPKVEEVVEETFEETPTEADDKQLEEWANSFKAEIEAVETPSEASNEAEGTDTNEEPKEEPTEAENKPIEEPTEEPKDDVVEKPKAEDNHLEELVNSLKAEIEALKELNGGLQDKINEMGKQPSTKPINTNGKPSKEDTYSQWRLQMKNMIG